MLTAAIEITEIPLDGRALTEILRILDRLDAKVSEAVGEFDARQLWQIDMSPSLVDWLTHHARMTDAEARALAVVSLRLRSCPLTRDSWWHGVLSSGQIRAITAALTAANAPRYAAQEADLVPRLIGLAVPETAAIMRTWATRTAGLDAADANGDTDADAAGAGAGDGATDEPDGDEPDGDHRG